MLLQNDIAPAPRLHAMAAKARPRIEALDMTKGVLIVAMVIYHSFNYSTDYNTCLFFHPLSF
jgi:uncharacterized membrane protein